MNQELETLLTNLQDADCKEEFIHTCLLKYQDHNLKALVKLLKCHRCCLIDDLHLQQKKIECLDYLIYQLKKEQETNE